MILVEKPGLFSTIQDIGRHGYQQFGVVVSGAMDPLAHQLSNILVGNPPSETTIEITMSGPTLTFFSDCVIAICGGEFQASIENQSIPMWRTIYVRKNSTLKIGPTLKGARGYIAISGGIDVPNQLNSKSTYIKANLGGLKGRPLQKNDILHIGNEADLNKKIKKSLCSSPSHFSLMKQSISPNVYTYITDRSIQFTKGIHYDWLHQNAKTLMQSNCFTVTPQSNRMGYQLDGPNLLLNKKQEVLSTAVNVGTIQVLPSGKPIILLADRQTTGGYPMIGQVSLADLPKLAQTRIGE
ncbi:biotin-dependent carboxyltransferase family protein [Bacillus carboniphilus]|uniref:Biotin-dependent carboxyltransferase family protein n=1 Tax=Bacillus carboniphilus TaxID=86663 RepID=A0ABY9JVY9_9BACI|nr:biotin-dependent carboxyltransferase family protein [Bacillus carboniphilus]WLR42438.1 biotin-dependent carboxyltransferase family protein [Bacillus carboniphilus]